MIKITFRWKCPYCGLENKAIPDSIAGAELLSCDVEEGGCDKYSVVIYSVETFTTVKSVEGELESFNAEKEMEGK